MPSLHFLTISRLLMGTARNFVDEENDSFSCNEQYFNLSIILYPQVEPCL